MRQQLTRRRPDAEQRGHIGPRKQQQPARGEVRQIGFATCFKQQNIVEAAEIHLTWHRERAMAGARARPRLKFEIRLQRLDRLLRRIIEQERPERPALDQQQRGQVIVHPYAVGQPPCKRTIAPVAWRLLG